MRILAIDFGKKRLGLALSDPLGITAQSLGVLVRKSWEEDLSRLKVLVREHGVERIVLGLPLRLDGTRGEEAAEVIALRDRLQAALSLPVELWDERFSTVAAEKSLLEADLSRKKRKKVIDSVAAVLILQSYLESKKA